MPPTEVPSPNAKLPKSLKWMTVEPPVFFFAVATGIVTYSNTHLYIERTCQLGSDLFGNGTTFSDEVCSNLSNFDYINQERYVEYQISRLNYVSAALQATPAILVTLFVGAWSDVYGRRQLIFLPLFGFVIRDAVFLVISQIKSISPDFLLLESLHDITGGLPVLMLGVFAHLSDFTTNKSRTSRMAIMEMFYLMGLSIGTALMDPLFRIGGYAPVYILGLILVICGMLSVPFFVKRPKIRRNLDGILSDVTYAEEYDEEEDDEEGAVILTWWQKFKKVFHPKFAVKTVKTGLKSRDHDKRHMIWITLFIFGAIELVTGAERLVDILYIRKKYKYESIRDFSKWFDTFYAIYTVWGLICMAIFVPVLKQIYHLRDPVIIMLSVTGSFLRNLIFLLARDRDNLYIGSFLDLFNLAGIVACRSTVVSLVDRKEAGKVLALSAITQELVSVLWPLSTLLYSETLDWHVGLIYCINSTILVIAFLGGLYLLWQFRKHKIQNWPKQKKRRKMMIKKTIITRAKSISEEPIVSNEHRDAGVEEDVEQRAHL